VAIQDVLGSYSDGSGATRLIVRLDADGGRGVRKLQIFVPSHMSTDDFLTLRRWKTEALRFRFGPAIPLCQGLEPTLQALVPKLLATLEDDADPFVLTDEACLKELSAVQELESHGLVCKSVRQSDENHKVSEESGSPTSWRLTPAAGRTIHMCSELSGGDLALVPRPDTAIKDMHVFELAMCLRYDGWTCRVRSPRELSKTKGSLTNAIPSPYMYVSDEMAIKREKVYWIRHNDVVLHSQYLKLLLLAESDYPDTEIKHLQPTAYYTDLLERRPVEERKGINKVRRPKSECFAFEAVGTRPQAVLQTHVKTKPPKPSRRKRGARKALEGPLPTAGLEPGPLDELEDFDDAESNATMDGSMDGSGANSGHEDHSDLDVPSELSKDSPRPVSPGSQPKSEPANAESDSSSSSSSSTTSSSSSSSTDSEKTSQASSVTVSDQGGQRGGANRSLQPAGVDEYGFHWSEILDKDAVRCGWKVICNCEGHRGGNVCRRERQFAINGGEARVLRLLKFWMSQAHADGINTQRDHVSQRDRRWGKHIEPKCKRLFNKFEPNVIS
jgi:hypothetical protein